MRRRVPTKALAAWLAGCALVQAQTDPVATPAVAATVTF
jgi:hypothetical protein